MNEVRAGIICAAALFWLSAFASTPAGSPEGSPEPAPTPGAIALLVDHASDPAAQLKLASALADSRSEVRAASARVINAAAVHEMLPRILDALRAESDLEAGCEEMDAVAALGGTEDDELLLLAATRLGSRAGRALPSYLARARGPSAVAFVLSHRDVLPLDAGNAPGFFAQSIHHDAAALADSASMALRLEDDSAWEALLALAGEFEREPGLDLLLSGLRSSSARIQGASAWNLVARWATVRPVSVEGPLAALKAGAAVTENPSAGADVTLGRQVLARILGAKAVEKDAWISFIQGKEVSHLDDVAVARAAMTRLTRAEAKALKKRYERLYPFKPVRPSLLEPSGNGDASDGRRPKLEPADLGIRTIAGYPRGFVSDLLAVSGCRPLLVKTMALAEVEYTGTGRTLVNGTVILPEALGPACRDAAKILFATSLPREGRIAEFHDGAVACQPVRGWRECLSSEAGQKGPA
jgi:hypothetical protein